MKRSALLAIAALALAGLLALVLLPSPGGAPDSPTGFPGEWRDAPPGVFENFSLLWAPHWSAEGDALRALGRYSHLRLDDSLAEPLARGESPSLRVTLVARAAEPGWHEVGVVAPPYGPNEVRILHRWLSDATDGWRTIEFDVPGGLALEGLWYVSDGTTLREARVRAAA